MAFDFSFDVNNIPASLASSKIVMKKLKMVRMRDGVGWEGTLTKDGVPWVLASNRGDGSCSDLRLLPREERFPMGPECNLLTTMVDFMEKGDTLEAGIEKYKAAMK